MGNKEKILNKFEEFGSLTIGELDQKLPSLSKAEIRTYVHRLKKKGKLRGTEEYRNRFKVYQLKNGEYKIIMKNRELHDKVDTLSKDKNSLKKHLKFLMDFFQQNVEILAPKNQKFFQENQAKFETIGKIIEEGG